MQTPNLPKLVTETARFMTLARPFGLKVWLATGTYGTMQAPKGAGQEAPTLLVAGRFCEKANFETPSVKLPQ